MLKFLLIAVGGAVGSILRYLVHGSVQRWVDPLDDGAVFPLGTLTVNVLGCLVIGMLTALFSGPWPLREEYRIGLTVGLLGGFTTFSTFGLESFGLVKKGNLRLALVYVLASCLLGFTAVLVGYRVVTRVLEM